MLRTKYVWATAGKRAGYASWMNVVARSWRPRFSPLAYWSNVAVGEVQTVLRKAFGRWGMPLRLRVDNGTPWGSPGDLPTDLALWLLGLGVETWTNPPRRPQENGVVERSQGTGKRWAEPGACADVGELQKRLQEMDLIQREEYPSLGGRSRLAVYPELKHSGRPYCRSWERRHWSLDRVLGHLTGYVVARKVDKSGTVSLYNRNHYVGKLHAGKRVYVTLDPLRREWVMSDEHGHQLRAQPAEQISRQRIESLTVTSRR
jgi:transposase InsO family protein